jgi:phage terminase large subunit-like protein
LPWQKFILSTVYGWVRKTDGLRRFQRAYVAVPRKNGKSTIAAGIGLYGLTCDGETGAQVYCAATTLRQAMYVFQPAKVQAERTQKLFKLLGLQVNAQSLVVPSTNSRFTPICSNPGDGGGASTFICDEFHEHLDSILFDAITRGMGARRQPLTWVITTAGSNIAGPCFDMERDVKGILEGTFERERTFGIVYALDEGDDWTSVLSAQKANPSWGVSVIPDTYMNELEEAIQNASKQGSFRTKRLNEWMNAASGFYNMASWANCYDPDMTLEGFAGQECLIGLDLASKLDLCAAVKVFTRQIEGEDHYYVFPICYLPESQTEQPENSHFQKWRIDGNLVATPGNATDFGYILNDLLGDTATYKVKELCFDQREAGFLTQLVAAQTDAELVEISQNTSSLSEPMKWLQSLVVMGRIHHNNNPVLTWCISNVIAREDANENVFPRKAKPELKIDAHAALLNAIVRVRSSFTQNSKAWAFAPFSI